MTTRRNAPPGGREVRHRVQQLHARPAGRQRHQRELPERPLRPAASGDRHHHGAHTASQLAGQARPGVAVDERDELELGGALEQRGHQFASVGLAPAGLPGHEVEQIEPDAHQRASSDRARRTSRQ